MRDPAFPLVCLICFGCFPLLFLTRPAPIENLWFSLFALCFAVDSFCPTDIKNKLLDNFCILQKRESCSLFVILPLFPAGALSLAYTGSQEAGAWQ
jgi:hypothetical protein